MPKKIIWAPLAESDFSAILEHLNKNWDSKVSWKS
jgi:plasmid stabilization system protein ParE